MKAKCNHKGIYLQNYFEFTSPRCTIDTQPTCIVYYKYTIRLDEKILRCGGSQTFTTIENLTLASFDRCKSLSCTDTYRKSSFSSTY